MPPCYTLFAVFIPSDRKDEVQDITLSFLTDCPNVPELHIKFDEAFKLVNLSGEQYEQILQVVRHHTEDTSYLLNKMKERFGWVSELSNMTIGPENIFNIVKVRVVFWRELLLPLTCILLVLTLLWVVDACTCVMFGFTTRCSYSSWICVCLVIPQWAETPEIRNYFPLNPFSLMDGWQANLNHCLIRVNWH